MMTMITTAMTLTMVMTTTTMMIMRIMMMMVTFLRILQANEIIDNIKEFFIRDLKKNVWMDDETKQSAKDKVS